MSKLEQACTSVAKAELLASAIDALQRGIPQATVDTFFDEDRPGFVRSVYRNSDSGSPLLYMAELDGWYQVLIGRTPNAGAALDLWNGYFDVTFSAPFSATNGYLTRVTNFLWGILQGWMTRPGYPIRFAGYSLGGAIAQRMALLARDPGGDIPPECITFGAPRCMGYDEGQSFPFTQTLRWMNNDDPVPLVPLPEGGLPSYAPFVSILQMNKARLFVHGPGGSQITADAVVSGQTWPQNAGISPQVSFGTWLWSVMDGSINTHSLVTYLERFRKWLDDHDGTTSGGDWHDDDIVGDDWEDQRLIPPLVLKRQQADQAEIIAATQAVQQLTSTTIPPENQVYVTRQGRVYSVNWSGRVITVTTHKRTAHQLARNFNATLRSLQHQAIVQPGSLNDAFSEYLQNAADPALPFNPHLNTQWPQQ